MYDAAWYLFGKPAYMYIHQYLSDWTISSQHIQIYHNFDILNYYVIYLIFKISEYSSTPTDSPLSHAGGILSIHPVVNEELRRN